MNAGMQIIQIISLSKIDHGGAMIAFIIGYFVHMKTIPQFLLNYKL